MTTGVNASVNLGVSLASAGPLTAGPIAFDALYIPCMSQLVLSESGSAPKSHHIET